MSTFTRTEALDALDQLHYEDFFVGAAVVKGETKNRRLSARDITWRSRKARTPEKYFVLDCGRAVSVFLRAMSVWEGNIKVRSGKKSEVLQKEFTFVLCKNFLRALVDGDCGKNVSGTVKARVVKEGTIEGYEQFGFMKVAIGKVEYDLPADFYRTFRSAITEMYPTSRTMSY